MIVLWIFLGIVGLIFLICLISLYSFLLEEKLNKKFSNDFINFCNNVFMHILGFVFWILDKIGYNEEE